MLKQDRYAGLIEGGIGGVVAGGLLQMQILESDLPSAADETVGIPERTKRAGSIVMKKLFLGIAVLGIAGCASCQQPPAVSGGLPIMGATASVPATQGAGEATPAIGIGWETISFSIPKPRLFAVPKPQQGPQVVGIPIIAGGPTMAVAQPAIMGQPAMMAQTMVAAPQTVPVQNPGGTQGTPATQGSPGCTSCQGQQGCAEGCTSTEAELETLTQQLAELTTELAEQQKSSN